MKTADQWKSEIISSIERLKRRNLRNYYGFSLEMSRETEIVLKDYFISEGYEVSIVKCPRGFRDVIISW